MRMKAVGRNACYKSIPPNQCWQARPRTCHGPVSELSTGHLERMLGQSLALNGDPPALGVDLIQIRCGQCQVDGPDNVE
jgi:hypothetical protein